MNQITHRYAKAALVLLLSALVCGGLSVVFFRFVVPQEYSSEIRILVIQKYTLTDSYTASKSAEKVSQNLAEVVKTSSFFSDVSSAKQVDLSSFLLLSEANRRKAWEKKIDTDVLSNTSLLKITVYDRDPAIAEAMANAIAKVLVEEGSEYHGAPDTISLKVVDTALTSNHPTRPNLLLNGLAAALIGAIGAAIIVFFRLRPRQVSFPSDHSRGGVHPHSSRERSSVSEMMTEEMTPEVLYTVLDVSNFHRQLAGRAEEAFFSLRSEVKALPQPK